MIDEKKFYTADDYPSRKTSKRIWNNINPNLSKQKEKISIELRSFSFGVAFTFIIAVITISALDLIPRFIANQKSSDVKINRAYSSVSEQLEKLLPDYIAQLDNSERVRGQLQVHLEELSNVDQAIKMFRSTISTAGYSNLEQDKLMELYQLKIEAINKIFQIKKGSWL